ncbi:MAG: hypothetical protein SFZ23_12475 [Planctomycetota bacterium]|nr:hypothetical protein [Planctomycetota bacterium]
MAKPSADKSAASRPAAKAAGDKSSAAKPRLPRIVLLSGPDVFMQGEELAGLKAAITESVGDFDYFRFDGSSSPAEILDECRSFGLMARHKLVVVESAESVVKESARPLFERYAASPEESTTLVLRATKWFKGNLDKLIDAVGVRVDCSGVDPARARSWAMARAKTHHRALLEPAAADAMIDLLGTNLAALDSEIGKLAAAGAEPVDATTGAPADGGGAASGATGIAKITPELVKQFVGMRREEEVWDVQRSLLQASPEDVIGHVRRLLDVSRAPATLLMWAITDLARKVFLASAALQQRMPAPMIAKEIRLWGPSTQLVLGAASQASPGRWRAVYDACIRMDSRSKSGLADAERGVERLALLFARAARKPN